jgi:uncharacterized protein
MSIVEQLKEDIKIAMKARDMEKLSTLRMVNASLKNYAIEVQRELTDADAVDVLTKEAKKRRQAADAYEEAGRSELAAKEQAELEWIQEYLPAQLTDDEVGRIIDEIIESEGIESRRQMGQVMGAVMARVKGRFDGSRVKDLVLARLE